MGERREGGRDCLWGRKKVVFVIGSMLWQGLGRSNEVDLRVVEFQRGRVKTLSHARESEN